MIMMYNENLFEMVCAATYVENYLNCVENLPDDLQRMISRMRELNVNYLENVREAQCQADLWKNTAFRNDTERITIIRKMQSSLIAAQDLATEKAHLSMELQDKIGNKAIQLDQDLKNIHFSPKEREIFQRNQNTPVSNNETSNNVTQTLVCNLNKRPRRIIKLTTKGLSYLKNRRGKLAAQLSRIEGKPRTKNPREKNKTKTKNPRKKNTVKNNKNKKIVKPQPSKKRQSKKVEIDSDSDSTTDSDEPMYCICQKKSSGKMIQCDNDLCYIEWFHFSCLKLATKPKGKWYCPKCRGDKPTVMKPRSQFFQELAMYNKEKEEMA